MSGQLDRVLAQALGRAWKAGAGPGKGRLVIDINSFIGEVHGRAKEGAGYGYTRKLGYHPLLATRAQTSEVLHVRSARDRQTPSAARCASSMSCSRACEQPARVVRADSGFWNKCVIARLRSFRR